MIIYWIGITSTLALLLAVRNVRTEGGLSGCLSLLVQCILFVGLILLLISLFL